MTTSGRPPSRKTATGSAKTGGLEPDTRGGGTDSADVIPRIDLAGMSRDALLVLYRTMEQARQFEEKLYYLFLTGAMPGTMHQATGQEAVAVGVCAALNDDDTITSTHRGHEHCIAKGVPIQEMMCEMFAKRGGSCRGMGGSMHLTDFDRGMLGAFGIVGAGIPIATGAAMSAQIRKSSQVSVAFFGDGAINEGVFHESLNMASLWKLPVIYVCENNHYALSMTNERSSAVPEPYKRSSCYNIPSQRVDGNDVVAVLGAMRKAVARARAGDGPTLLDCLTYRIRGHARFEPGNYRDNAEVEEWKLRDPLERLQLSMMDAGLAGESDLNAIRDEIDEKTDQAIAYARQGEDAESLDYRQYIFKEPLS